MKKLPVFSICCVYAVIGVFIPGVIVWGQAVPLPNPSFETGDASPDGWRLSGGNGGFTDDAAAGRHAVYVAGETNSQASTFWYTEPLPFEANAVYCLSLQARRVEGSGGSPILGPEFCNRDLHEVTEDWKRYTSYFVAPVSNTSVPLRIGQWNAGGIIAFDDLSLVRAVPIYRRCNGIMLGDGEHIEGDHYVFTAPLAGDSANHARPLLGYDCFFNKPRWVFSQEHQVLYRHEVGDTVQTAGDVEVTVGYHTGGTLVLEASGDGETWMEVGHLTGLGTLQASVPATVYPAKQITVRLTTRPSAEQPDVPVHLQVYGYTYRATLDSAPGNFHGATRFMVVPHSDEKVQLVFEDLGEAIPGGTNEFCFIASNMTGSPITITPRLHITTGGPGCTASIPPLTLPADAESGTRVTMPYDIPDAGDVTLTLNLGDDVAYTAETRFTVSHLFESGYGHALPDSSDNIALWWASSGWKVSRSRPAPRETSAAMRLQLAQNEREAAQFVVRPSESLRDLRITAQPLQGSSGATLPTEAVEVLRVGYVPVSQPTDYMGAVAPWPDPLPPLDGTVDLAADENQPFWVRIHTTADTPAGTYRGEILLEAEGWRGTVPLEVEVFDFALPDRKTCVSAFGFDASLAFRYHNAQTEADRRIVYESYLALLSDHHISIYNPAFLDPIRYSWPHLPKWQGGKRDTADSRNGVSLLLHDESDKANVAALYDEMFAIPDKGIRIAFDYKTGDPDHIFLITLLHHDASGEWLPGRNNDMLITGDETWQRFETVTTAFPEAAEQFKLRLWATCFSEEGSAVGTVWIDNIEVRDLDTDTVLLQDDFTPPDAAAMETAFVPKFDWTAWDAAMTRAFEHYHFNAFALGVPGMGGGTFHSRWEPSLLGYGEDTPEYKTAFNAWCGTAVAHLQAKGWLDDAYVYWFDEPTPDDYAFVMNGFLKLKEAAPGLGRMLTEKIVPELVGGPNIWCPISYNYNHERAEQRRAAGEKIWWYVCTGPKAPYATLFIDHPATELRVWLWQTWERAIDGILIWQTNFWHSDEAYPDAPQNPYQDPMGWTTGYSTPVGAKRPWGNGDGRFLYPPLAAADGQPTAPVFDPPVGSIRLDMLRDGIEDYEYCVILRDLLDAHGENLGEDVTGYRQLLEVPDAITTSLTEFSLDPAPLEAHREAIARTIMEVRRALQ